MSFVIRSHAALNVLAEKGFYACSKHLVYGSICVIHWVYAYNMLNTLYYLRCMLGYFKLALKYVGCVSRYVGADETKTVRMENE